MFRVSYFDPSKQRQVNAEFYTGKATLSHALLAAKTAQSIQFEKQLENGQWLPDSDTQATFNQRIAQKSKNLPDLELASKLASLASVAGDLGKLATRKVLTDEQKQKIVSLLVDCANLPSLKEHFNRPAAAPAPAPAQAQEPKPAQEHKAQAPGQAHNAQAQAGKK